MENRLMANAKKIVVSNKEDQIKTIKTINFDNITPIIKEDKTLKISNTDPRFSHDLVDQIRGSENERIQKILSWLMN